MQAILMSLKNRDQWRKDITNQTLIGPYISTSAVYQVEEFADIWHKEQQIPPLAEILKVFIQLKQDGVDFIKITLENNPPKEFFYRNKKSFANLHSIKISQSIRISTKTGLKGKFRNLSSRLKSILIDFNQFFPYF